MLKIANAVSLALSKIRAHKFWYAFVFMLEAIMVAAAIIASCLASAISYDLKEYSQNSLSGRYVAGVTSPKYNSNSSLEKNEEIWDLADRLYDEQTSKRREVAKKYAIEYDAGLGEKPTGYSEGVREFYAWTKYGQMALRQYVDGLRIDDSERALREKLENYNYKHMYAWHNLVANGNILPLKGDKEDFSGYRTASSPEQESFLGGFRVLSEEYYADFVVGDFDAESKEIPIVISVKIAGEILGLDDKGKDDFLTIRRKITGQIVEACFRNDASRQMVFAVGQGQSDAQSVEYALPDELCGAVEIKKDKRTEEEKAYELRRDSFLKELGEYEEAYQEKLIFKIIGVVPTREDLQFATASDLYGMVQEFGAIQLSTPIIPKSYYDANKERLGKIFVDYSQVTDYSGVASGYLVEFSDSNSLQVFVNKESCGSFENGCLDPEKPFFIAQENKSVLLANIADALRRVVYGASLAALALALVITVITISRSIKSEQKEISIYKAIGYKNRHIVQIYTTQVFLMLCFVMFVAVSLSVVCGTILAGVAGAGVEDVLRKIFSTYDKVIETKVFIFDYIYVLNVFAIFALSTTLIGAVTASIASNKNIVAGLRYE